jgi:hypothetical protein
MNFATYAEENIDSVSAIKKKIFLITQYHNIFNNCSEQIEDEIKMG